MYSPAKCIGCEIKAVTGDPDPEHISTSYIRRFTRLTNGFSKKVDNRTAQIAIFMVVYNFSRKHMTPGTTPAVKAGIADHVWSIEAACSRFSSSRYPCRFGRAVHSSPRTCPWLSASRTTRTLSCRLPPRPTGIARIMAKRQYRSKPTTINHPAASLLSPKLYLAIIL